MHRAACFSCFGLVVSSILGCGEGLPAGKVIGLVTFDGTPLPVGVVAIHSEDGKTVRVARVSKRGNFEIPDAPLGKVKVALSFPVLPIYDGGKVLITKNEDSPKPIVESDVPTITREIPMKYKDVQKSGLAFFIKPGQNEIKVELTKNSLGKK